MFSAATGAFLNSQYESFSRQPRAVVYLNDVQVLWEDIQINTTTLFVADNFSLTIPLSGQNSNFNMNYWSAVSVINVRIYIGLPINADSYTADDLELFFVGTVDNLSVNPLNATMTLIGRDLTSTMIDTKITELYPSQTASYIATQIAQANGLNPVVTPTTGNVGRFFNNFTSNAQSMPIKQSTQWDLLTFLAQQSGYVVFVQQDNLYFQPFPTDAEAAYILNFQPAKFAGGSPTFFGMDLKFKRSLTLANSVTVNVVVPYNPQSGQSFIKTANYTRQSTQLQNVPAPTDKPQIYNFTMAGLSPAQAQAQANTLAQNITLQEIVINATVPGDNLLQKNSLIQLQGTNSFFDGTYYIDNVTRSINVSAGYLMQITAKNKSPLTQLKTS